VILWDLAFYEPWFFGLGVLTTLAALYHHQRAGGSEKARRRLALATLAGTIALTAVASVSVST
jgi:hypothetical protein